MIINDKDIMLDENGMRFILIDNESECGQEYTIVFTRVYVDDILEEVDDEE